MNSGNSLLQLAMRPFQEGAVDVATLAKYVEEWVARPPIQPLPEQQTYLDILEGGIPSNERFARVLDLEGRLLARLDSESEEAILDIEFLTDTELLVAMEKALRKWDTETEEVRVVCDGKHWMINVSTHRFITCSYEAVWLFNRSTLTGQELLPKETMDPCTLAIAPALPRCACHWLNLESSAGTHSVTLT